MNGLMSEGEIGQTVQDVGGLTQVPKATGRVVDALSDVGNSLVTQLTTGIDAGEDYRNSTKFRQATLEFQAENPELVAVLNNKGESSSEDYQAAMQAYTDKLQDTMGADAANAYLYDDAQIADKRLTGKNGVGKDGYGMADMDKGDVYVNIGKTDMSNTEQVIKVLGHENMHATGERSEVVAERAEDQASNAWERENAYNGNTTGGGYESGVDFYVSQADTTTVRMGSEQADGVDDVAAKTFVKYGGKENLLLEYPKDRDVIVDIDKKLHDLPVGTWDEKTMTYTIENEGYGKDQVEVFKSKVEVKANIDKDDYGLDAEAVVLRAKSENKTNTLFGEGNLVKAEAGFGVNLNDVSIGAKAMITSVKGSVTTEKEILGDKYRLKLDGGILGLGAEGEVGILKPKVKAGVYVGVGGSTTLEKMND